MHPENQYLDLLQSILKNGDLKEDRTGVGTKSIFGTRMSFSLREGFPLFTTKKIYWKGVVEELLFFIKGDTNANNLSEKGVKIWNANGSREFLDKVGLSHRQEGDLGPIYGWQWRHFGAKYVDMNTDYTGQGIDQLQNIISTIKNNPNDRRIVMSAWNVSDIPQMCLPPCHIMCQFYVSNGELSCSMYQRSADMGLGVPFNVASYSLLTLMIAQVCGLKPGNFIHMMGDTHIYKNHFQALEQQCKLTPMELPRVELNPEIKSIDDFKSSDIKLINYISHPAIKMEMAL